MRKITYIFGLLLLFFSCGTIAQPASLRQKIEQVISTKKADIGVSIIGIENHDTMSMNGNKHFPMLSVFKFHVALSVLHEVDEGKLSLNQKIYIKKNDLLLNTWSPIVAHKTGTSDTNGKGVTAAVNDIGIVSLPNGKHFAISVFVTNSKENYDTNEKIIADITKLAWSYFRS